MQQSKRLISVLIISSVVGSVVLWALYTPTNHRLNSGTSRYPPKQNNHGTDSEAVERHVGNPKTQHGSTFNDHRKQNYSKPVVDRLFHIKNSHTNSRKPSKVTSDTQQSSSGYIITQTYGGQMTRAIRNLMLQQCWGDTLRGINQTLYIVEPFSARSNLFHLPTFWEALGHPGAVNAAPRFSDYYDLEYYNKYSIHNNSLPLATWEEFIQKAPRSAVAVITPRTSCGRSRTALSVSGSKPPLQLNSNCVGLKPFRLLVAGLKKRGFSVERTVCITCDHLTGGPLSLQQLYDEIYQGRTVSETTIILSSWRSYGFTSTWLQVPRYCQLGEDPTSSKRLIPSNSIIDNTLYYKSNILKSDKVIAIMLRIERFLTLVATGRSNGESVQSCINKTLAIRDRVRGEKSGLSQSGTFLTLDIGRFGSGIMQDEDVVKRFGHDSLQSIQDTVSETVRILYDGKYSMETWEDTFVEASGGIDERGYIAMLQRNIATESDCLILMGGGSFQQVAAFQYFKSHPDPSTRCLYSVCVADSFAKSIT